MLRSFCEAALKPVTFHLGSYRDRMVGLNDFMLKSQIERKHELHLELLLREVWLWQ